MDVMSGSLPIYMLMYLQYFFTLCLSPMGDVEIANNSRTFFKLVFFGHHQWKRNSPVVFPFSPKSYIPAYGYRKEWLIGNHLIQYEWDELFTYTACFLGSKQIYHRFPHQFPRPRVCLLILVISSMDGAWLLEQPRSSALEWLPEVRQLWRCIPKDRVDCWLAINIL